MLLYVLAPCLVLPLHEHQKSSPWKRMSTTQSAQRNTAY